MWSVCLLAKEYVSYTDMLQGDYCLNAAGISTQTSGSLCGCEWVVDLSVSTLQRSLRETNGATVVRGASIARLTDFIAVSGTWFHNPWSFPFVFQSHADIISMPHMNGCCFSLFSDFSLGNERLLWAVLCGIGVLHLFWVYRRSQISCLANYFTKDKLETMINQEFFHSFCAQIQCIKCFLFNLRKWNAHSKYFTK